jgi:hypothetical protein
VFASGDLNKDGKLDLVVGNNSVLSVLLGNGAGGFSQTSFSNVLRNPAGIVIADLNGDGNLDVIVGNQNKTEGSVFVFPGNGAGGFGTRGIQSGVCADAVFRLPAPQSERRGTAITRATISG